MIKPVNLAAVQHMMRCLDGVARVLGLDEATTRAIVEKVVTEMPNQHVEDRVAEARLRMIVASA
jgi:hypothetical protein